MILYNSHISPSFSKERFTSEKNGTGRYVSDRKHNNLSFLCFKKLCMSNFCVTHTHTHTHTFFSPRVLYDLFSKYQRDSHFVSLSYAPDNTLFSELYISLLKRNIAHIMPAIARSKCPEPLRAIFIPNTNHILHYDY